MVYLLLPWKIFADSGSSSGSDSDEDSVQSPYVEAAKEAPKT